MYKGLNLGNILKLARLKPFKFFDTCNGKDKLEIDFDCKRNNHMDFRTRRIVVIAFTVQKPAATEICS